MSKQKGLLEANSLLERRGMEKALSLREGIVAFEIQLNDKINKAKLGFIAEQAAAGKTATAEQLKDVEKRFTEEQTQLQALNDSYEGFQEKVVIRFVEMEVAARQFGAGVKEAFLIFKDEVENNAKFGTDLFTTMTQGWEDAFVKFAETGKLSFKDLFKSLMIEIIKMAANRLFLALFDPSGGLFSSLFAGFFANGGNIPGGKFGIAGENGPEIVAGPASVMSNADSMRAMGGQNITYNISAVDTQSFQNALSRDPEFIYALTRAGRRRLPG